MWGAFLVRIVEARFSEIRYRGYPRLRRGPVRRRAVRGCTFIFQNTTFIHVSIYTHFQKPTPPHLIALVRGGEPKRKKILYRVAWRFNFFWGVLSKCKTTREAYVEAALMAVEEFTLRTSDWRRGPLPTPALRLGSLGST